MSLAAAVPDGSTVLVDSAPIIYVFEGNPLAARFEPLFADIDAGRISALVSPVTLAEVAAGPLKVGRDDLAERYRHALTSAFGWALRELDADIALLAARIRVRDGLKLPDAIQVATAIHEGCYAVVTHDRDYRRSGGVLLLGT